MKLKIELSTDSTKPEGVEVMKKLLMAALVLLIGIAFVPTGCARSKEAPEKAPAREAPEKVAPKEPSSEAETKGFRVCGESNND